MQQIQFIREGMNNYMTIVSQYRLNRASYADTILEIAEIPCFMNYEIREINGEQTLYYTLKYRTSLRQVLGDISFTFDKVRNMVLSMVDALKQAEAYLLNQDFIAWNMDCTFIEISTGRLVFTYHPGKKCERDMKSFLMEFMQYIDKKNQQTYMFLMNVYNQVTNPNCNLDQLITYIEKNGTERQEPESSDIFDTTIKGVSGECDTVPDEIKENQKSGKSLLAVVALTIANLIEVLCLICEIWTYQYIWVLVITIFLLLVALLIHFRVNGEDNPDKIMEEYMKNYQKDSVNSIYYHQRERPEEMETTVLAVNDSEQEIVIEDEPKELFLRAMKPKGCPDVLLDKKSVLIGSLAEGTDYLLRERGISRFHAKIIKRELEYAIIDMNSRNGTYLNDNLLESGKEYLIQEGDVIAFAYVAVFVVESK